jgi:hypothetical protein
LIVIEEGAQEGNRKIAEAWSRLKEGTASPAIERHPRDAAWDVLIQAAKPMHYRELVAEIIARGVSIGGRDPGNTLIAYLGRDKRFVKAPEIKRGFWKLKEWTK